MINIRIRIRSQKKIRSSLIPMAKDYQSEKSPIFYSQKSKKTRRKLLKMSKKIKAYKIDQMFCITRYCLIIPVTAVLM